MPPEYEDDPELEIELTAEDVARGTLVREAMWLRTLVKDVVVGVAVTSGVKKWTVYLVVKTPGEYENVPLQRVFSINALGFWKPFIIACGGKVDKKGGKFQMGSAKGKIIETYVKRGMYKNPTSGDESEVNNAADFAPLGTHTK